MSLSIYQERQAKLISTAEGPGQGTICHYPVPIPGRQEVTGDIQADVHDILEVAARSCLGPRV